MSHVCTDDEYLQYLYESQKDDPWLEAFIRVQPKVESRLAIWAEQGLCSPEERSAASRLSWSADSPLAKTEFEGNRLGDCGRRKRSAPPRPMSAEWVLEIRDQCERHDVAFFFKQWGGRNKKAAGRSLEGVRHDTFPKPKKRRQVRQTA